MKSKFYLFIVISSLNLGILNAQQYAIRKISPIISPPGGNVSITLKTPTGFSYNSNASMDISFKSRTTNNVEFYIAVTNFGYFWQWAGNYPNVNHTIIKDTLRKYSFSLPSYAPLGLYDLILNNVSAPTQYPFTPYTRIPIQTILGGFFIEGGSIAGNLYYDTDGNGIKNGLEVFLPNQEVRLNNHTFSGSNLSDGNGLYKLVVPVGTYTVQPALKANWLVTSSASSFVLSVSTSSSFTNRNFGLRNTNPPGTIVSSFTVNRLRCNTNVQGVIDYTNNDGFIPNGTIKLLKDPMATITGVTPTNSSANGDTLVWNITNLIPEERRKITVNFDVPGAGFIGNYMNFLVKSQTTSTGFSYLYSDIIRCSYDPNDKTLYAAARVNPDTLSFATTRMEYLVRFENTGNDTAYTVMVRDTLDTNLDFSSLQFVSSSHNVSISKYPSSRALLFRFNTINLPATSQDPIKSHGYIKFLVTRNNSLPEGTRVNAKASIYFDLNPAVVTNNVRTTFATIITTLPYSNSGNESNLKVYPNPSSGEVYFSLGSEAIDKVEIFDLMGNKVLETHSVGIRNPSMSVDGLSDAVYYYRVKCSSGKTVGGTLLKKQ